MKLLTVILILAVANIATATTATATEWQIGHRADPATTVDSQERETDVKIKVDQKTVVESGATSIVPKTISGKIFIEIGEKKTNLEWGEDGEVGLAPSDPKETPKKEEDSKETPKKEEDSKETPKKEEDSKKRSAGTVVVRGNQGNTSVARGDVINNNYGSNFFLPEGGGRKKVTVRRRVYRVRPANRGFAGIGLR